MKKNYRKSVAYHNWRHAFNTAQSMFALLKSGRLQVGAAPNSPSNRPFDIRSSQQACLWFSSLSPPVLSVVGRQNNLNDLEVLALMIATLSHDLDHRGVNNSYIQR